MSYITRMCDLEDMEFITSIYNEGIEDRIATMETRLRTRSEMKKWFLNRTQRYKVVVIEDELENVCGWAALDPFSSKDCYSGVGDVSIYIKRECREKGLGKILMNYLISVASQQEFHKMVLTIIDYNEIAKRLYKSLNFREVGTYGNQGILRGKFVNITIMEKLL